MALHSVPDVYDHTLVLTGVGMSIYHKFCLSSFNFKLLLSIHLFLILDPDLAARFC